ncbi:putative methyltransferase DDB_G0268948 [Mya arenaria]|uniref:putative methyltransferase DDB_G0268948 n=1 Tax=Mya arenaria TaxID=6604 RepID=UPI0022E90F5E|nr:putative methyltransferase DDB_G0268948 [Mya arenaria]
MARSCLSQKLLKYILREEYLETAIRTMSIRLFEDKYHAELYARFRPTYSSAVYETIFQFYEDSKSSKLNYDLAVDVGCGNGQSSKPLCSKFRRVIGYDVSEEQVKSARNDVDNLTFRVGPGEDLRFLENNSVDLVTIAQALHWLDRDVFYQEVERVLKPGGVFGGYGYGNNVLDDGVANQLVKEFYSGLLGPYWDEQRSHIDNMYRNIPVPLACQTRLEGEELGIRRRMPVDAFVGYLSTWSAWRKYLRENPETRALNDVADSLKERYGDREIDVFWPGFLLLGRKPA